MSKKNKNIFIFYQIYLILFFINSSTYLLQEKFLLLFGISFGSLFFKRGWSLDLFIISFYWLDYVFVSSYTLLLLVKLLNNLSSVAN